MLCARHSTARIMPGSVLSRIVIVTEIAGGSAMRSKKVRALTKGEEKVVVAFSRGMGSACYCYIISIVLLIAASTATVTATAT